MSRRNMPGRRNTFALAIGAAVALAVSATAWTAESDDQTVNFDVQAINSIDVDNAAVSLTINSATASGPSDDSDSSSYSITTTIEELKNDLAREQAIEDLGSKLRRPGVSLRLVASGRQS